MLAHRNCFLPGTDRTCSRDCMAYVDDGKTNCRLLNIVEKFAPIPTRPVVPTPPTLPRTK